MAGAFQPNAFQNNAFQTSGTTSTIALQKPINCVLIGQQLYDKSGRTFEIHPPRIRTRTVMAPSFKVTTNRKGYD